MQRFVEFCVHPLYLQKAEVSSLGTLSIHSFQVSSIEILLKNINVLSSTIKLSSIQTMILFLAHTMLDYVHVHLLHAVMALTDETKAVVMEVVYGIVAEHFCKNGTANYIQPHTTAGINFMEKFASYYDQTIPSKVKNFLTFFSKNNV